MPIPVLDIDADTAIELLSDVVEIAGPETIVKDCVNVYPDGAPCCIVGHALVYGGLLPEELLRAHQGGTFVGDLDTSWTKEPVVEWRDSLAKDIWQTAQTIQDDGDSWGHALEGARRVYSGEDREDVINDVLDEYFETMVESE